MVQMHGEWIGTTSKINILREIDCLVFKLEEGEDEYKSESTKKKSSLKFPLYSLGKENLVVCFASLRISGHFSILSLLFSKAV